jgi:uncharacterized RDD family membrane protein YckC
MTKYYYILTEGKTEGPFTQEELQARNLHAENPVWSYAKNQWRPAREFPEIMPGFAANTETSFGAIPPPPPAPGTNFGVNEYFGYELATKWQRFLGFIVETLVFVGIIMVAYLPGLIMLYFENDYSFDLTPQVDFAKDLAVSALGFGLSITIGMVCYPYFFGNIGHKALNIKVISAKDGSDYNKIEQGAMREGAKTVLGWGFILNLWLLFNEHNQNLYDKIAQTYVVKKKLM